MVTRIFWGAVCALELAGAWAFFYASQKSDLAPNLVISARILGGACLFFAALIAAKEIVPVKYRIK